MNVKSTLMLLTGIVALIGIGTPAFAQSATKEVTLTRLDSVSILDVPLDSIDIVHNLKFKPFKRNAHASYYADKFNGKRTASGKKFNNNKYTAAHRKLPFGTKLRITNEKNGKFVIVEVNDRGPFTKGREIDLTRRAFMDIAHDKRSGHVDVTIEIIEKEAGK